MANVRMLTLVAAILVIAGGINWGLVGLLNVDIISRIIGHGLARVVFILVGAAAGYLIYLKIMNKVDLQIL